MPCVVNFHVAEISNQTIFIEVLQLSGGGRGYNRGRDGNRSYMGYNSGDRQRTDRYDNRRDRYGVST